MLENDYNERITKLEITDPKLKKIDTIAENDLFKIPLLSWVNLISFLRQSQDIFDTGEINPLNHLTPQERRKGVNFSLHRIENVRLYKDRNLTVVLFRILRSQCLNDPPNKLWFVFNEDGQILDGYCSCLCGHTGRCSHSVGALIFLERHHATRPTCTDVECYWNGNPNSGQLKPTPMKEMFYKKVDVPMTNGHESSSRCKAQFNKDTSSNCTEEEIKSLFDKMKNSGAAPNSVLFKHSEAVVFNPTTVLRPPKFASNTMKSFVDKVKAFTSNKKDQIDLIVKEFHTYTDLKSKAFEKSSRFSWDEYHQYLITGRNGKSVYDRMESRKRINVDVTSLVTKVEESGLSNISSKAITYGLQNEQKAIDLFMEEKGEFYNKSDENGIHLDINYPYVGSTPDSILVSKESGERIPLEIKCSFKFKGVDYKEGFLKQLDFLTCSIHPKKSDPCDCDETKFILKEKHQYYYQVMMELGTLRAPYGYFVVFFGETQPMFVKKIEFNSTFYRRMIRNFELFYIKFFLPKILDYYENCDGCHGSLDPLPLLENKKNEFCLMCKRKFHLTCLNDNKMCKTC